LQEVVVVPGGVEAFIFDTEFLGVVVFQKAQRGAADQAEVGVAVAFADPRLVFAERYPFTAFRRSRGVARSPTDGRRVAAECERGGNGAFRTCPA